MKIYFAFPHQKPCVWPAKMIKHHLNSTNLLEIVVLYRIYTPFAPIFWVIVGVFMAVWQQGSAQPLERHQGVLPGR